MGVCGPWGMREDVAGRSKSRATWLWDDLWSHSNMWQGLSPGKGICLPMTSGRARGLPLPQWLFISPISPSVGIISTGSQLIYRQVNHIPFSSSNI